MQSTDYLHGFPPGYFLIKATNSSNSGKNMLLDVSRSERQPGVELVLWIDETQSLWPFGDNWNDHQVFFMCQDGILRSKATGHPIGCKFDDETGALKLVTQSPRPFNHRSHRLCHFSYDLQSKSIIMHLPDEKPVAQICGLKRYESGDSGICVAVTSGDDASCYGGTEVDPGSHVLEFVPKGHRYRKLSQVFTGILESPGDETRSRKPSSSIIPESSAEEADADDSWQKGREIRMVRRHGCTTRFQEWDIIPLGSPSCDESDDEWSVID
ncbi:unnamed protein product [Rhizoctonia solani]|uniref:Uncharacterized protein n=1 Tax=Rhizoctonia solani TaxID=456999 RepID=A0A8H3HQW6_9AGAM|nr:unnamed protein product [Rhizoctonia solani]